MNRRAFVRIDIGLNSARRQRRIFRDSSCRARTDWLAFDSAFDNAAAALLGHRNLTLTRFDIFGFGYLDLLALDKFAIKVCRILRIVRVERFGNADCTALDQGDTRNRGGKLCSSQFERHKSEPRNVMASMQRIRTSTCSPCVLQIRSLLSQVS
ncbi:hypothetical protein [Erythrobacter sp. MTPC3]|uniref:hypothetical protein n=1 Tax=Erythrobacter sp. MTPC3 TaxID=3056564 RepID=UPI0036F3D060